MGRVLLRVGASLIAACLVVASCSAKLPGVSANTGSVQGKVDPWEAIIDRLDGLPSAAWAAHVEIRRNYPFHNDGTVLISVALLDDILSESELASIHHTPSDGFGEFTVVLLRYGNETATEMCLGRDASVTLVDTRGNSYRALDPDELLSDLRVSLDIVFRTPNYMLERLYPGARIYVCQVFPLTKATVKQLNISDWSAGGHYDAILKFRK